MQSDTTSEFADRLQSSFAQIFGQVVPALLGAAGIIFAGYLLATVLPRLAARGLRGLGLDRRRHGGGGRPGGKKRPVGQGVAFARSAIRPATPLTGVW